MAHQHTIERLRTLRLTGMAEALRQQMTQPEIGQISFEERLALLVDEELLYRDNRTSLTYGHWVKRKQNLCITGPTGTGKT